MKYLGLWLVVAAGIGLGRYYSRRLYRRAERLQQLVLLLQTLQQQLTYTALPLSALWRRLAAVRPSGRCRCCRPRRRLWRPGSPSARPMRLDGVPCRRWPDPG